ncbi:F-box/LRR-repeat protein 2 [Nymphaea thermarum]|nr:F-box/LRR-repeat protein 2 [Nymphaea thermarum]
MEGCCPELPEDCWRLIFARLALCHTRHLDSPSLACKHFLAIANCLVSSLTLRFPFRSPSPFSRFPNLVSVDVSFGFFGGQLDRLLRDLAASGARIRTLDLSGQGPLPLCRMKELGRSVPTLKGLVCSRVKALSDRVLIVIADSFPNLEELDVSYPVEDGTVEYPGEGLGSTGKVSDAGVEFVSRKLGNLLSLDLSGNYCISDRSLLSIALNCASLRRLAALDCEFLSGDGVAFVASRCRDLESLSVNGSRISLSRPGANVFLVPGWELQSLDLSGMDVSNHLLLAISNLGGSLRRLILPRCEGVSLQGVSEVVQRCELLEHLDLEAAAFLTDEAVKLIGFRLTDLKFINLSSCHRLTNESLRTILTNAANLEEIRMERTDLGKGTGFSECKFRRARIRRLRLGWNKHLDDEILSEIIGICGEIKELSVNDCLRISRVRGLEKLEVLEAGRSGLSDEGLEEVGRSCRGMARLGLEGCRGVTEQGVKEVVRMCKALREVNLSRCARIWVGLLCWMVIARPSLRRIAPPGDFHPSEAHKKIMLIRHGCLLCTSEEWGAELRNGCRI